MKVNIPLKKEVKVKLVTVVEGDPKAPFSIATTLSLYNQYLFSTYFPYN